MFLAFPYDIDASGRTSTATPEEHVRQLIEALLFTSPRERVNRPTFGTGIQQLVFAPNSTALGAALQTTLRAALTQWIGDELVVDALTVAIEESTLTVTVTYTVKRGQVRRVEAFTRSAL